eukprot:Gb_06280 [translate_table: standard]
MLRMTWEPDLRRIISFAIMISCLLHSALAQETMFFFNKFKAGDLRLSGFASIESGVVKLTDNSFYTTGHAMYPLPVRLKKANTVISFSTTFVFCIVPLVPDWADQGMAFLIGPSRDLNTAAPGQYLGLLNITSDGQDYNHLFAVEFDTDRGYAFDDIDDNHVGVDINSLKSVEAQSAEHIYMGFSASTGKHPEAQYVLAWSFNTNGVAQDLDVSNLPNLGTAHKPSRPTWRFYQTVSISVAAAVLLLVSIGYAALRLLKRVNESESPEQWELEFWPHRFTYKELSLATKDSNEVLIGFGGFGRVYRGVLPGSDLEVAVKCIAHESKQGMREFIAEIASIGRLQHRNLAQLKGWCRRWPQRFKILKDIAAALLYLHEEWEQSVVHRDIKSSNVLLDREFNGRLGDFGLARISQHGKIPNTTSVAGTPDYLAPELTRIGKATTNSDVFSFGALLLEVACGRRPVELNKAPEEEVLVEWVWDLFSKGQLLDTVDKKLEGEYVVEEMERVLQLGLLCSHPKDECRPSTRQVVQILEGDAPLPLVPLSMPNFNAGRQHEIISCSWSQTSTSSSVKPES